jgi:hypothetical protein
MKNKKGQLDNPIVAFVIVAIFLILMAPIMLKIFLNINSGVGNSLGNITGGGDLARANFQAVTGTLITFWDKVIIAAFALSVIILFVSAFMIDAHPFFIILYIILNMFLIIFAPNFLGAVDNIYDSAQFAAEVNYLPFLNTLRTNFVPILVGIILITGIIIYGKLAFTNRGNNRR